MLDLRRFQNKMYASLMAWLLLAGLLGSTAARAQTQVNGRLERIGTFRLCRVWGTPKEMGFAQGYLLGKDFVSDLPVLVGAYYGSDVSRYDKALGSLKDFIEIPESAQAEIEGIFEGIKSVYGVAPRIELLKRRLRIEDLIYHNSLDVLRAFGCSGFTVWGDQAAEAGVISARNFDYPAFGRSVLGHQLILVREPQGRRKVATITWPCYIGAFTGINSAGVGMFMHDGTGRQSSKPEKTYVPAALVLKDLLETSDATSALRRSRNRFRSLYNPYSYMLRVVVPWVGGVARPEVVFRVDADGLGVNPSLPWSCITTNHYLNDKFKPVGEAGRGSVRRYKVLRKKLKKDTITGKVAWKALDAVAASEPHNGTLHALVFYPERRRLELAFATWTDAFVAATKNPPVSITFDELFGH